MYSMPLMWRTTMRTWYNTLYFDKSFLSELWRQAYVTPVFKKGDSSAVGNYIDQYLLHAYCVNSWNV